MDDNFKSFAKRLVASNTHDAIKFLAKSVKTDSSAHNQLLLFENNYARHISSFHKGLLTYEEFTAYIGRVSMGLLNLIDDVDAEELSSLDILQGTQKREIQERSNRFVASQIIKIDDKKENLKQRKLSNSLLFPLGWFLGVTLMLIATIGEQRNFLEYVYKENIFLGFLLFGLSVFFGIMVIRILTSYFQNDKEIARKIEQLRIEVKGEYEHVMDGIVHTLMDLKCQVTDFNFEKGIVEADIYNRRIKHWFLASPIEMYRGQRIKIEIAQKDDIISIHSYSTSKTTNSIAHEGDIFGAQRRINLDNLKNIQDNILGNLIR